MNNLDITSTAAAPSAKEKEPIAWAFIIVFSALLLGNNLFSKIVLLFCLIYFSYKNIANVKNIYQSLKGVIWLIFLGIWAAASTIWSVVPSVTADIVFTQAAFFCLSALMANYATDKDISQSLKITALFVLCLIIIFGLIFPGAANSPQGFKAFYANKNNLGVVLAICIIAICYSAKPKWHEYGIATIALALLVISQSKTSLTVITVVGTISLIVYLFRHFYSRISIFAQGMLALLASGIPPLLYIVIAIGVLFRDLIAGVLIEVLPYKFLTGRGELWLMVLKRTELDLLTGLGLGSFWNAGPLSEVAQTSLLAKAPLWIEKLGSADGGYIDLVGSLGFVGLALLLMSFIGNYKYIIRIAGDSSAKMMMAIITFFAIHNLTETTILHSTNSLWFLYIFSSFYIVIKANKLHKKQLS